MSYDNISKFPKIHFRQGKFTALANALWGRGETKGYNLSVGNKEKHFAPTFG
jgi:hypothetical protein